MDNLAIFPFKFKYLKLLHEISEARGGELTKHLTMKELPKIGFIAILGKTPIAAGFLRRVEPNHGMFDSFFTNPYFGSQIRHSALQKILDALLEEAKDHGLKTIIGLTKDDGIFKRAMDLDFQVANYTIIIKQLP